MHITPSLFTILAPFQITNCTSFTAAMIDFHTIKLLSAYLKLSVCAMLFHTTQFWPFLILGVSATWGWRATM